MSGLPEALIPQVVPAARNPLGSVIDPVDDFAIPALYLKLAHDESLCLTCYTDAGPAMFGPAWLMGFTPLY